jgi:2-hydroxy-4-carboxymuconate semialdehyde hemiacetal dehydrogenase
MQAGMFAGSYGIPYYGDTQRVLQDPDIDAVLICSPSDVHKDQARDALLAGKHVLCEIPMVMSLSALDELQATATSVGRILMAAHTQRFFPGLRELRHRVALGRISVYCVVARSIFLRRSNVNWRGRNRTWTDNLVWHHGGHLVDSVLWALGAQEVESIAAVAGAKHQATASGYGLPMDVGIVARTPKGQALTFTLSYNSASAFDDLVFVAEEGTFIVADGRLWKESELLVGADPDPLPPAIVEQDAAFVRSVASCSESPISAASIRPAISLLQNVQDQVQKYYAGGRQ